MFELHPSPKIALPGNGQLPAALEEQANSLSLLKRLISTLIRRRIAALAIFVGFVLLVVLGTIVTPKQYTTQVKFIAGNASGAVSPGGAGADSSLPVLNALLIASGVQSGETYAELFQELPVAQQVIADLQLKVGPGTLLKYVSVKPVTNTSILSLSSSWSSPELSAQIANDFAKVIVERQRDLVASQASQAITFLSQELPTAEARMRTTSTALAAYETVHHLTDSGTGTQGVISNLASLDARISQAQVDARQATAQLNAVQGQMASTPMTISGDTNVTVNPTYAALQTQIAQGEVQLGIARKQYTDKHPAVIALVNQLRALNRQLATTPATVQASSNTIPNPQYQQLQQQAAQFSAQQASTAAQIATLSAQRHSLNPELAQLPGDVAQLANLERDARSAQEVVTALQQKYDSASVAKTSALSDVTVTQDASAASASVSPSLSSNTLLAFVLGIVLAIGGVLVIDYFDDSIKTEADAEERLALPHLGSVPDVRRKNGFAVPWVQSLAIESFLQLVTALKYSLDTPMRTVAFTSPSQGDGKSTTTLNTAIAMSELEPRVLLIDGDLRRPSLHTKLHLENEGGLSDILIGRRDLREVVLSTRYPGLDILPSGTPTPNPIKLLQSQNFERLLETALQTYRYVFLDSPACSVNFDAAILCSKADGTVVVVSAGITQSRAATSALKKLEHIGVRNIVGFVLNRAIPDRSQFDGYYLQEIPDDDDRAKRLMIEA